jgi:para-nitrobenzyl esterase
MYKYNSMKKILLSIVPVLIIANSFAQVDCAGGRYYTPIFANIDSAMNVVYGNSEFSAGNFQDLKMDIWWPAGDVVQHRPLVIMAHGGSFIAGTKSDAGMAEHCRWLASMGYVAASIDYRLANVIDIVLSADVESTYVNVVYKAVHDEMAAVRFFRENEAVGGNTYQIDPSLVIVGGFSAGSIMGLHLTYMDHPSELHPDIVEANDGGFYGNSGHPGYPVNPQAVLNYCGALADTIYMQAGDVPLMSIHGTADGTVPFGTALANPGIPVMVVSGSGSIHERALNVGVTNPLLAYVGRDHCEFWQTAAQADSTYQFAVDFLQDQLCIQHLYTEQHPNSVFFTAYPNPTTEQMVIDIPGNDTEWNYTIVNMVGQQVRAGIIPKGQKVYNLDVSGLETGMYVVSIASGAKKASQKILVK